MNNDTRCFQPKSEFEQQIVSDKKLNIIKILHICWQKLVNYIQTNHSEIQVWQKKDRNGNKYWQAYDSFSQSSFSSASEIDIRMWIEEKMRMKY